MSFKEQVTKIFQENKLVGAGCVVVQKQQDDYQIVENITHGMAILESQKPLTSKTIFRIASVSKMVVALSMMSLVQANKASIDSDISDILGFLVRNPYFPKKPITIKMLMTQTSSITDGYNDDLDTTLGYNGVNGHRFSVDLKDLLVFNEGPYYTPLTWDQHEPGSTFIYSNFGCGILACLIEKLANEPFTDYVKKVIFDPMKIDASFKATTIKQQDEIASLYYSQKDETFKLARSQNDFLKNVYPLFSLGNNFRGPAGGMFISLEGLAKLGEIFLNRGVVNHKQILEPQTIDLMLTRHWQGERFDYYAKGLQIRFLPFENALLKGHTGSAYGLSSMLFFNEETKTAICFAANGGFFSQAEFGLNQVQYQLLKVYYESFVKKLI